MSFLQSLVTELQLQSKSTANKSLNQMREEVKLNLQAEQEMDELIKTISEESTRAEAMKRIMRYVPCILHYENRCGINFFDMLLIEGLSNAQGGN